MIAPRRESSWKAQLAALRRELPESLFAECWDDAKDWPIDQALRRAVSTESEKVAA